MQGGKIIRRTQPPCSDVYGDFPQKSPGGGKGIIPIVIGNPGPDSANAGIGIEAFQDLVDNGTTGNGIKGYLRIEVGIRSPGVPFGIAQSDFRLLKHHPGVQLNADGVVPQGGVVVPVVVNPEIRLENRRHGAYPVLPEDMPVEGPCAPGLVLRVQACNT